MARYNKATETMIDLVCSDINLLERYGTTSETSSYRSLPIVEAFKNEVLDDHGLTDDRIEAEFMNGYVNDPLIIVAVQAFISQVNWKQVLTKYKRERPQDLWW